MGHTESSAPPLRFSAPPPHRNAVPTLVQPFLGVGVVSCAVDESFIVFCPPPSPYVDIGEGHIFAKQIRPHSFTCSQDAGALITGEDWRKTSTIFAAAQHLPWV